MAKQEYVVGFMFSPDLDEVILIEKTKPDWQRGKLNGVGGKIEYAEEPLDAMIREFREETGVSHPFWYKFAELDGSWFDGTTSDWIVHFFYSVPRLDKFCEAKTMTEEQVYQIKLRHLDIGVKEKIPNLSWLIPMALTIHKGHETCKEFRITEIAR